MTALRPYAAAALLATACSGPSAPADPTWADVQSILASNCVRCHGAPPIDGAPDGFRLDVYDDTVLPDGRVIRGAAAMGPFLAMRTNPHRASDFGYELMPPIVHLEDWQEQTLCRWGGNTALPLPDGVGSPFSIDEAGYCDHALEIGALPPRGDGETNSTIELLEPLADAGGLVTFHYQIEDPDHDLVRGWLGVGGSDCANDRRIGELRSGRHTLVWDTTTEPEGSRRLAACLDDGAGAPRELGVWRHLVDHGGNTPPVVVIRSPSGPTLLHTSDSAVPVEVFIGDPDPGDALALTLRAVHPIHGVATIPLAGPTVQGSNTTTWNAAGLTADDGWTLEATVDDGVTPARTATLERIRISDATPASSYDPRDSATCEANLTDGCYGDGAGIGCIFNNKCVHCHDERVPGLITELLPPSATTRGWVHRRVVVHENMPPPSGGPGVQLCDSERARIADWLLGGSP